MDTSGELNTAVEDHRVRVAAERRDRMRRRLMEAASLVFGQRGVEASVIDEITAIAGVSRGTFYNYFRTNEETLKAVAIAVANELMQAVAPVVESHDDSAERMGAGVRSWMRLIQPRPHLAAFFRRAGLYALEQDTQVRVDMPRDLIMGMESGRFSVKDLELGFVLVAGTVLAAINTLAIGEPPPGYAESLAERILMSLGVDAAEARRIANMPLAYAELPADSLIERAAALQK